MPRSALEVVTAYIREAWNQGKVELIAELCTDPVIRHDANSVTRLSHAEQVERITHNYDELRPFFEEVVFAGDDEFVTLIWNVTGRDPNWKLCGIEVFRVADGKITEVWNSAYVDGRWGMSRTLVGSVGDGAATAMPVMVLEMADAAVEATVPLDARTIGRWLAQALGAPAISPFGEGLWKQRYAGNPVEPLTLTMHDKEAAPQALGAIALTRLHIGWARSGLINATISAKGTPVPPPSSALAQPEAALAPVRLAEPFGAFIRQEGTEARVVDASIEIGPDAPAAAGRVTLRIAGDLRSQGVLGAGELSFGWRAGALALTFEGTADLGEPENLFTDNGETEFTCAWTAKRVSAEIVNDVADGSGNG